jgi:hypothetical protein
MNTSTLRLIATSTIAAACLVACGGGGGGGGGTSLAGQTVTSGGSTTPTSPTQPTQPTQPAPPPATGTPAVQFGTTNLSMAAEPGCGFDAVNVTVTKIRFHMSATAASGDAGWTDIAINPGRRVNLAAMNNGALLALGTAALAPGHYAQARLVLDQNTDNTTTNSAVVTGASAETPLVTQIAAPDGVQINLGNGFDVVNGQTTNLVADFDGCRSVVPSGSKLWLHPVINAIPATANEIDGYVSPSLVGSKVRVSAQVNGVEVRATTPDANGKFVLARLTPGMYDIVITADNRAAAAVTGVMIDATSVVALNNTSDAIALAPSATGQIISVLILDPISPVESAFGSALQRFDNGVQVSIRDRMSNFDTGVVRMTSLPLALPSLAVWRAGQPLAWTAQATVIPGAGTYVISSSAPGYVTKGVVPYTAQ